MGVQQLPGMHAQPPLITSEDLYRFERRLYQHIDRGLGGLGQSTSPLGPSIGSGPSKNEIVELIKQTASGSLAVLKRNIVARSITLAANVAQQVIFNQLPLRGFIVLNPASALAGGITSFGTVLASAARVVGSSNTQLSSLGVANFSDLHLFLNVSNIAAGGTVTIDAQAVDPVSSNWANTQRVFDAIAATGTYYGELGQLGCTTDFAINATVATNTVTFSVGYVLKNGLPGTSTGGLRTIYLGGPNVTIVSGLPLLEGQSWTFYMDENVQLWAISPSNVLLNIFEMGT